MEQGYEVFRNVSCIGPMDIIAIELATNELLKIDVKTVRVKVLADGTKKYVSPNASSFIDGVNYLGYVAEEDNFIWLS